VDATHTSFPKGAPENLEFGGTFQENTKLMGLPAEVDRTVEGLEPGRLPLICGRGPMTVTVATRRSTLTPDGDAAPAVRVDGEFTGTAVPLTAGKLKGSATAALNESLRELANLAA
jgi:hypothetical protein